MPRPFMIDGYVGVICTAMDCAVTNDPEAEKRKQAEERAKQRLLYKMGVQKRQVDKWVRDWKKGKSAPA